MLLIIEFVMTHLRLYIRILFSDIRFILGIIQNFTSKFLFKLIYVKTFLECLMLVVLFYFRYLR